MSPELEKAIKNLSFPDAMKYLEEHGYIDNEGKPLKCTRCESSDLELTNFYHEGYYLVEYSIVCKHCNQDLGTWSYGSWQV